MAGMMKNIPLCFSFLDLQELVNTFHDIAYKDLQYRKLVCNLFFM